MLPWGQRAELVVAARDKDIKKNPHGEVRGHPGEEGEKEKRKGVTCAGRRLGGKREIPTPALLHPVCTHPGKQ